MTEIRRDRPAGDEIEVSLFGPGYGESVVIHLGSNRWMLLDSCLDKDSGSAAALAYLEEIGVEPASQVELVACTHWHDDHIRGISSILSACPNARFVCSTSLMRAHSSNSLLWAKPFEVLTGGLERIREDIPADHSAAATARTFTTES